MTENVIEMLVKIISESNHLNISINREVIRNKDGFFFLLEMKHVRKSSS